MNFKGDFFLGHPVQRYHANLYCWNVDACWRMHIAHGSRAKHWFRWKKRSPSAGCPTRSLNNKPKSSSRHLTRWLLPLRSYVIQYWPLSCRVPCLKVSVSSMFVCSTEGCHGPDQVRNENELHHHSTMITFYKVLRGLSASVPSQRKTKLGPRMLDLQERYIIQITVIMEDRRLQIFWNYNKCKRILTISNILDNSGSPRKIFCIALCLYMWVGGRSSIWKVFKFRVISPYICNVQ